MTPNNQTEVEDLLQRYRLGQMTDSEAEEFEVYLMDNPEMVETIELDSVFAHSLPHVVMAKPPVEGFDWRRFWYIPTVSFAAAALLCVMVLPQIWQPAGSNQHLAVSQVVYMDTLRSANQPVQVLPRTAPGQRLAIFIQPQPDAEGPFSAQLQGSEAATPLSLVDSITKMNTGEILLLLDSHNLTPGQYTLSLTELNTGVTDTYPLIVE